MDWLTFIASIVGSLAWPSVVVGVLLFLRKELPSIVRSLRKLKFRDVEMEFGEAAKALAAETKLAVPTSGVDFTILGQSYNAVLNRLNDLAEISPRATILEAWLLVETSAANYLGKHHDALRATYPGPLRILEGLRQAEVLTLPQEAAFEHLRRLRNDAVHTPEAEFTSKSVSNYVESALAMTAYLEGISQM